MKFDPEEHFARKVDEKTYAAIKEAREVEMAPSKVMRKLQNGTREGIDGPVDIKKRTFYEKWAKAKRELARARDPGNRPKFLDLLRVKMEEGWQDMGPNEIAARFEWTAEYTSAVLDAIVNMEQEKPTRGLPR